MRIEKVINNNVVSSYDEKGREVVIMGKGLGFQKKPGQTIAETSIEKIFRMESKEASEKFKSLLENLPLEHLQVSNDIISFAKKQLDMELNRNIYITLTDHINFAIERFHNKMLFQNALWREMRLYYPVEYKIGKFSLDLIETKVGIRFPEDEAASIAMHIINAEYNTSMKENYTITSFIQESIKIISQSLQIEIDDTSDDGERLISALKFLGLGLLKGAGHKEQDAFYDVIEVSLPKEYKCCQLIAEYAHIKYKCSMSTKEKAYLAIDIKRARGNSKLI